MVLHRVPQHSWQLCMSYFRNTGHVSPFLMHLLTMILHKSPVYKFTANGEKKCQSVICCHGNSWEVQCAEMHNWDGKIQVGLSWFLPLELLCSGNKGRGYIKASGSCIYLLDRCISVAKKTAANLIVVNLLECSTAFSLGFCFSLTLCFLPGKKISFIKESHTRWKVRQGQAKIKWKINVRGGEYRAAIFHLHSYGGFNFLKTFYMPGRDMSEWQSHYQASYQPWFCSALPEWILFSVVQ